jgi:tetratricopeptide (TPR) repeat protein
MRDHPSPGHGATGWISALAVLLALVNLGMTCTPSAEQHLRAARDAMYLGDARSALVRYEQAAQTAADDDSPRGQRLREAALREAADASYLDLHEPGRAATLYRELIQTEPATSEALEARISLARILRADFRDLRGAIVELTAVIARQPPGTARLRYELAKLYFELGDYAQCALESEAILERHAAESLAARATFLKAEALAMIEGRASEAICVLEELLKRFPRSELQPYALYELGRMRAAAGDLEAAIEQWVRSLKTHPHPEFIQSAIVRARKRLDQSSSASDHVAAAILANAVLDGLSTLRRANLLDEP